MATLTPTKLVGAQSRPTDLLYVEPEQQMSPEDARRAASRTRSNSAFVADLLSAMLTHERCGVHLYRSVDGRTTEPEAKKKYEEFGRADTAARRDPRATHRECRRQPELRQLPRPRRRGHELEVLESTFALGGSIDPVDPGDGDARRRLPRRVDRPRQLDHPRVLSTKSSPDGRCATSSRRRSTRSKRRKTSTSVGQRQHDSSSCCSSPGRDHE